MTMPTTSASIRRFLSDRNHWLIVAFGSFLILIVLFTILYYSAYGNDRTSFLFATDIVQRQGVAYRSEANARLSTLSQATVAVGEAITTLRSSYSAPIGKIDPHRIPTQSGLIVVLSTEMAGGAPLSTLSIEDSLGRTVFSWDRGPFEWPTDLRAIVAWLNRGQVEIEGEARTIRSRLLTLSTSAPDVWSVWDFLYFSVITQGTVGYGDILPNTTYVRSLVVIQVLAGYLVVLVILNWAVPRNNPHSRP